MNNIKLQITEKQARIIADALELYVGLGIGQTGFVAESLFALHPYLYKEKNFGPWEVKEIFETWTFDGLRFLAIDNGNETHIVDERGGNYGAWMSGVEGFRKRQQNGEAIAKTILNPAPMYKPVTLQVQFHGLM